MSNLFALQNRVDRLKGELKTALTANNRIATEEIEGELVEAHKQLTRAELEAAAEAKPKHATSDDNHDTGGFSGVGEIMQSLFAMHKRHAVDGRLEGLRIKAASFNEATGADGGYGVPEAYVVRALDDNFAVGQEPLLSNCDRQTMDTEKMTIPSFSDMTHSTAPWGITWGMIPEGGSWGTVQAVTMSKIALKANKAGALFKASNEWLSDSAGGIRSRLDGIFTTSLRWYIESLLWNGTGAGQPLGAIAAPGTLEIAKEGGQANGTIITENVIKMWARLRPGSHGRAIWVCNQTCLPQLLKLNLSVGTGGSNVGLLQPSGIAGAPSLQILGRPLYMSEHLPALGSAGDIMLIDPALYVLGDRRQVSIDLSEHLYFASDETAFRIQARFDGQPIVSSTFTPKNGDTCGWAVKLAAR